MSLENDDSRLRNSLWLRISYNQDKLFNVKVKDICSISESVPTEFRVALMY